MPLTPFPDAGVRLEWCRDSAWRFFPIEPDDLLGWKLHPFDALTNKALAMAGRAETRDLVDLVAHAGDSPLHAVVWVNFDGQPSRVVKYKYMKARACESATSTVKLGVSRQVVIPKTIHDQLGLRAGDYLQVEVAEGRVVFTPKTLVDKRIDQRIAESTEDFAAGRSYGPFESAEAMVKSLRAHVRARRGSRKVQR